MEVVNAVSHWRQIQLRHIRSHDACTERVCEEVHEAETSELMWWQLLRAKVRACITISCICCGLLFTLHRLLSDAQWPRVSRKRRSHYYITRHLLLSLLWPLHLEKFHDRFSYYNRLVYVWVKNMKQLRDLNRQKTWQEKNFGQWRRSI